MTDQELHAEPGAHGAARSTRTKIVVACGTAGVVVLGAVALLSLGHEGSGKGQVVESAVVQAQPVATDPTTVTTTTEAPAESSTTLDATAPGMPPSTSLPTTRAQSTVPAAAPAPAPTAPPTTVDQAAIDNCIAQQQARATSALQRTDAEEAQITGLGIPPTPDQTARWAEQRAAAHQMYDSAVSFCTSYFSH